MKKTQIKEEFGELAEFGWWFISGKFDTSWSINQLRESLSLCGRSEADHFVVETLTKFAPEFPSETVECLSMLVDGDRNQWGIASWATHAKTILASVLSSKIEPARSAAVSLINRLYARGFDEFQKLLNAA